MTDDRIIASPEQALVDLFPFDRDVVGVPGVALRGRELANLVASRLAGINRDVVNMVIRAFWDVIVESLLEGRPVSIPRIGTLYVALHCHRLFGHVWVQVHFRSFPSIRVMLRKRYPELVRRTQQVYVVLGKEAVAVDEDVELPSDQEGEDDGEV